VAATAIVLIELFRLLKRNYRTPALPNLFIGKKNSTVSSYIVLFLISFRLIKFEVMDDV
jgi:hypothetical protein